RPTPPPFPYTTLCRSGRGAGPVRRRSPRDGRRRRARPVTTGRPVDGTPTKGSDATTLGRAAPVVRLRRDVLDRADLEAGRLQRADRGLATRARALHEDVDLLHAVLLRLARSGLGREAGGEGGRLARALEADVAAGGPRDHGARRVRDRHDRVVERALDVRLAGGDVLLVLAARLAPSGG